nr:MAG TPA: hypothetical protein [Caudoviricetes sp.]
MAANAVSSLFILSSFVIVVIYLYVVYDANVNLSL